MGTSQVLLNNEVPWNWQSPPVGQSGANQLATALQKIPWDPGGMQFGLETTCSKTLQPARGRDLHRFSAVGRPLLVVSQQRTNVDMQEGVQGKVPCDGWNTGHVQEVEFNEPSF